MKDKAATPVTRTVTLWHSRGAIRINPAGSESLSTHEQLWVCAIYSGVDVWYGQTLGEWCTSYLAPVSITGALTGVLNLSASSRLLRSIVSVRSVWDPAFFRTLGAATPPLGLPTNPTSSFLQQLAKIARSQPDIDAFIDEFSSFLAPFPDGAREVGKTDLIKYYDHRSGLTNAKRRKLRSSSPASPASSPGTPNSSMNSPRRSRVDAFSLLPQQFPGSSLLKIGEETTQWEEGNDGMLIPQLGNKELTQLDNEGPSKVGNGLDNNNLDDDNSYMSLQPNVTLASRAHTASALTGSGASQLGNDLDNDSSTYNSDDNSDNDDLQYEHYWPEGVRRLATPEPPTKEKLQQAAARSPLALLKAIANAKDPQDDTGDEYRKAVRQSRRVRKAILDDFAITIGLDNVPLQETIDATERQITSYEDNRRVMREIRSSLGRYDICQQDQFLTIQCDPVGLDEEIVKLGTRLGKLRKAYTALTTAQVAEVNAFMSHHSTNRRFDQAWEEWQMWQSAWRGIGPNADIAKLVKYLEEPNKEPSLG